MISAAAEVQRRLWGTDPQAWAELAEAHNTPLFAAVLDAAGVGPGTRVLDVGCGSGLTLVLARQRGADGEIVCSWRYASMDDAVRGLLCSAGGARAVADAGVDRVRSALVVAMTPFLDRASGVVSMANTFRWVAARRAPA